MKNSINNRYTAVAVAFLFSLGLAFPALAIDEKNKAGVQLQFIGNIKNQPVFELSYNGTDAQEFAVAVLDNENTLLYKDVVKGNSITKKFLLNTEELGNADIRFEITNKKTNKTTTYEINRNTRYVQDLVVTKIK